MADAINAERYAGVLARVPVAAHAYLAADEVDQRHAYMVGAADALREADDQIAKLERERDEARANNARSICIFCGTITPFPVDAPPEERVRVMWQHAEHCDQRPEKRLAARIEELEAAIERVREAVVAWDDRRVGAEAPLIRETRVWRAIRALVKETEPAAP